MSNLATPAESWSAGQRLGPGVASRASWWRVETPLQVHVNLVCPSIYAIRATPTPSSCPSRHVLHLTCSATHPTPYICRSHHLLAACSISYSIFPLHALSSWAAGHSPIPARPARRCYDSAKGDPELLAAVAYLVSADLLRSDDISLLDTRPRRSTRWIPSRATTTAPSSPPSRRAPPAGHFTDDTTRPPTPDTRPPNPASSLLSSPPLVPVSESTMATAPLDQLTGCRATKATQVCLGS